MVHTMKNFVSGIANRLNSLSFDSNSDVSSTSNLNESQGSYRRIVMPEAKTGLGSMEGDLLSMAKRYLEIVGLVFFVWILGYYHFSVSWILLVVLIYLFRQRQRSQSKERHKMLSEIHHNEEQYIKARLDELPSWVFFPDVERAEWINRIIKQAWPYANKYLDKAIFHDIMIPMIRGTSAALSDFSFEKLDLGEIPPRIGGIKVYTDNVRDQIMMDIEVFYAGDAHIKSKVKGIVCGIKDIQFVGDLRVILSPLINTIPLFGAVTYFFLRKPSIDFKLTDAGTLVDIPGLNDLMLAQINDIVASMMVLPNRQVFPLVSDIPTGYLRWSNPQGVIRVIVLKARDLVKADLTLLGKGKSDPFVKVKAQGTEYKTRTINNTTEPAWNEVFEFVVEQCETDAVEFELYDEDPGNDDFIGRAEFPINNMVNKDAVETWLTLKDVKTGSINVCLQYFHLNTQKAALDIIEKTSYPLIPPERLAKALLIVYIDRCADLPRSKKTRREPNPYCRIKVDQLERKTQTFESQTNPVFEHISHMLCANPIQQKVIIEVCDASSNNAVIGFMELPIKQIFDANLMTIDTQSFSLKSLTEPLDRAAVIVRLSLNILSPGQSSPLQQSSPTNSSKSFESDKTTSADVKQSIRSTLENDPSIKIMPSNTQQQVNKRAFVSSAKEDNHEDLKRIPIDLQDNAVLPEGEDRVVRSSTLPSHPLPDSNLSSNRDTLLISDDPDLTSTPYGQIKLGIRYIPNRKSLSVTVFACKNLMTVHNQNLPDPYIRVYLMPDFKKDKKKTKSIHDSINPVYEDLFEWSASLADIQRQHLLLSVKNNSPLFAQEHTYMGDIQIDLSNLDPEHNSVAWYALQEPDTSGGGIMKIKYDIREESAEF